VAEVTVVKVKWVAYSVKTGGNEHYSSNNNYSVRSGSVVSVGAYLIVNVCACASMHEWVWALEFSSTLF